MKTLCKFFLFLSLFSGMALTSCESDDDTNPPAPNESELITDLTLTFTDADAQTSFDVRFSDADGPGGNAPTQDPIVLNAGTVYQVVVKVEDRSNPSDPEDITVEVQAEGAEHQFFYVADVSLADALSITYDPAGVDANGSPIGILTNWIAIMATSGAHSLRVVLRHEPNKAAPGASVGVLSEAVAGETDIDVTFNLTINP